MLQSVIGAAYKTLPNWIMLKEQLNLFGNIVF